ncbi:HNH endonuclease [Shigella virus Moo19]|uniref:HNH homing endonuclease n=1 Tax=Shigella virus Moo19 TaxID=2886042 RepID=A0AAE8YCL3_9CAUD|nr:HNH endonuclease [Shigella virus Moo19]UEN68854.1 HNH homing endonuclease [Shigella virus Moo19]
MSKLTQQRLKELLHYDPLTGIFTRRISLSNRTPVGSVAGSLNKSDGYVYITVDSIRESAHRLAWLYEKGVWPKGLIDHRDTIRHHNWIANLREADKSTNGANRGLNINNTTGFMGVAKFRKGYRAAIKVNHKSYFLGVFPKANDAAKVYDQAAIEHFGEFAVTNMSLGLIT